MVYNRSMMKIDKEKDREIIRMRDKLGCTWQSIGSAYGITRQGAQDYYNRAKRRQVAKRNPIEGLLDKLYRKITRRLIIEPDARED